MPDPFDPSAHGFVLLRDFAIPPSVKVYEYRNHAAADGTHDFLRINLYMTRDGSYVTIWYGLLEPLFTEAEFTEGRLKSVERPEDLAFLNDYGEDLFRGHIDSRETATHIFKALRIGEPRHYGGFAQVLRAGPDNQLRCDVIQDEIA